VAPPFRPSFSITTLLASGILALITGVASSEAAPARPASGEPIVLGHALAPLYGPWNFQIGDSPLDPATNKPLWAEPGFDDSQWETIDLTPHPGIVDPFLGNPEYVQGWTAKGHPGYWGLCVVPHPRVGGSGARREAGGGNQRCG
jgi:hypothetical protein